MSTMARMAPLLLLFPTLLLGSVSITSALSQPPNGYKKWRIEQTPEGLGPATETIIWVPITDYVGDTYAGDVLSSPPEGADVLQPWTTIY